MSLIHYMLIGGARGGDDRNDFRGIPGNPKTSENPWAGYIDLAEKSYANGIRRFGLHNPFGVLTGEAMQFDQALDAKQTGFKTLISSFTKYWKAVVPKYDEFICYLGTLKDNPEGNDNFFEEYKKDAKHKFTDRLWCGRTLNRFVQSIKPILDVGGKTSIGFDASSSLAPNKLETVQTPNKTDPLAYYLIKVTLELLKAADRGTVYTEARPMKDSPWLDDPRIGVLSVTNFWRRSDPDLYSDSKAWAASNSQIKGEVMIMCDAKDGWLVNSDYRYDSNGSPGWVNWDTFNFCKTVIKTGKAYGCTWTPSAFLHSLTKTQVEDLLAL